MTTNYHTPITTGAAANSSVVNSPLAQLDAELTDQGARITVVEGDIPVPSGVVTEYYDGSGGFSVPAGTGVGVDGHLVQDEGVDLPQRAALNFVGAGVTVTNETGGTQVSIPGDYVKISSLPDYIDTIIKGMKLIWNSTSSISIDVGSCFTENGDFINAVSLLTASSLSLSNSTWYHVYSYLNISTPAVEVTTTAPVAWKSGAFSKTGSTTHRYIGSIKTNSSGGIYNFTHDPNMNLILYRKQEINAAPFRCLVSGTASTATAIPLSAVIPVTGSLAYARLINTSDRVIYTSIDNAASVSDFSVSLVSGNVVQTSLIVYHPFDASKQAWYFIISAPSVGGASFDVYGYIFQR